MELLSCGKCNKDVKEDPSSGQRGGMTAAAVNQSTAAGSLNGVNAENEEEEMFEDDSLSQFSDILSEDELQQSRSL